MRILAIVIGAHLTACGAAPPPKPPPKIVLRTLAPQVSPAPANLPFLRYAILANRGIPDVSDIENRLGRKGAVADVGETARGMEIALAGVVCELTSSPRPDDVPKSILPAELTEHELSDDEGKALAGAKSAFLLECKADEELPPRNLPPEGEVAAEALAELMDGWIGDQLTGRYWPRGKWRASRKANKRYESERSIRVITERYNDGNYWIGTRGMKAFGRPDLEIFPVPDGRMEAMYVQLRVLADLLIDETSVGSGTVISLGPVEALLLERDAYANTLPAGTSGRDRQTPGPSTARLALVDPKGEIGNLGQHLAFLRRLAVR
jgi:hypothetical protein